MKLLKLVLSSLIVSCLASCGDSVGGSSSSDTTADTTAAVTAEASAPESLSSGTSIAFNPEITLQGELSVGNPTQASYVNESLTGDFPSGSGTITVSLAKNSNQLELTFTHGGKKIELKLGNFLDLGSTGYLDQFEVESFIDGVSKGKTQGRFVGASKPRNAAISKPIDTSGAPNENEFKKYIVGKPLRHQGDDEDDDDGGFEIYNADGTVTSYELDGTKDPEVGTYSYSYNGGDPRLYLKEAYQNGKGETVKTEETIKLTFTNFYEGTYKVLESSDYDSEGGSGTWQIFNGIEF